MKTKKPKKSPAPFRRHEIRPPTGTNQQLEVTAETLEGVQEGFDHHNDLIQPRILRNSHKTGS